jgi:hypothetical protein
LRETERTFVLPVEGAVSTAAAKSVGFGVSFTIEVKDEQLTTDGRDPI